MFTHFKKTALIEFLRHHALIQWCDCVRLVIHVDQYLLHRGDGLSFLSIIIAFGMLMQWRCIL